MQISGNYNLIIITINNFEIKSIKLLNNTYWINTGNTYYGFYCRM